MNIVRDIKFNSKFEIWYAKPEETLVNKIAVLENIWNLSWDIYDFTNSSSNQKEVSIRSFHYYLICIQYTNTSNFIAELEKSISKKKEVVALDSLGYIQLPQSFRAKGSMVEWTVVVVIELTRDRMSILNNSMNGYGIRSLETPTLIIFFPNKFILANALYKINF